MYAYKEAFYSAAASVSDPHWFFADPDPSNLVSADPDKIKIKSPNFSKIFIL